MKPSITPLAILTAALALAGCMGPQGNPNGQPYADAGMIAFAPQPAAAVAYDPNVVPPSFRDLEISQPALNAPAAPSNRPPSRQP